MPMRRVPRSIFEKGFFHVMVQGINKKYIFEDDDAKKYYINLLNAYKEKYQITILAYCIMDNHAHVLVYADKIFSLSDYMKIINSRFAREFNERNDRVGYVFRDRFKSQFISDDYYLIKCIHYIHMNPVTAEIVNEPEQYKYSTYNDYVSGKMNLDKLKEILGKDNNYLSVIDKDIDLEIEIMDVDREFKNLEIAINNYLKNEGKTLDHIKENKNEMMKMCNYSIIEKGYKRRMFADYLGLDKKRIDYIIKRLKKDLNVDNTVVK